MKAKLLRLAAISGLAGSSLIIAGSAITALGYQGRAGEAYSPLNHFISELGEMGVSPLAPVFNACLIIGGLMLTIYLLGLARYLGGWFGWAFGLIGLVTGVFGSLVGVFPMNHLATHVKVATVFFRAGLGTTFIFSVYVLFFGRDRFPKAAAIPGGLAALCFAAFIYTGLTTLPHGTTLAIPPDFQRPDIWPVPLLEWSVFVSVLLWVAVVALFLLSRARRP